MDQNSFIPCQHCPRSASKKHNGKDYCGECYEDVLVDMCGRKSISGANRPSKDNKVQKFRISRSR